MAGLFDKKKDLTEKEVDTILENIGESYTITNVPTIALDKLTGCLISKTFSEDLEKTIANAGEKYTDVTLAVLDIDDFMHVNEDFGHKTGDEVLIEIAKVLLGIEAEKSVYRYSGDEFAIIFPNMEKEQAFLLMEKVRDAVSKTDVCVKTVSTISVGIATYPEDGTKHTDLLRKADGAMYRAKSSGRNKVCIAKEEKLVTKTAHYTVEQLKMLKELSESISAGEAALMREALDDLLKKYDAKKKLERTVLIADDAAFMRMMLKDITEKVGFKVIGEVVDGNGVLDQFEILNPDFLLLDIVMPNMDGLEALGKIVKKPKNHIIMVSAMGKANFIIDAFKKGADAFVIKPFQADKIIEVMNDTSRYSVAADKLEKFEEEINKLVKSKGDENASLTQAELENIISDLQKNKK